MRISSFVPPFASARASARMDSSLRLRNLPRSAGMMQNVHGWSQPSAILR